MAAALGVSLFLPFSNSTSLSTKIISISPKNITYKKVALCNRKVSAGRKVFSIRADAKTEVAGQGSKKQDQGLVENKFTKTDPLISECLCNYKITGDDSPEEIRHIVFLTEGELQNREGQTVGVIPDGVDSDGEPRYYTIASSARGDKGDYKTASLCVKRDAGAGATFLCNLEPGAEAKITGPTIGFRRMLMPKDPNATIIMVRASSFVVTIRLTATGDVSEPGVFWKQPLYFLGDSGKLATETGIAPFRSFMWKMFFEEHDDYKFNGLAWLFFGVPTSSSLLYKEEFEKMKEMAPKKLKLDYALSCEQIYIQTIMYKYAEELWSLLKKDNTFVYMCGHRDMEPGIDDLMTSIALKHGVKWADYKKQLVKAEQWAVEVY